MGKPEVERFLTSKLLESEYLAGQLSANFCV